MALKPVGDRLIVELKQDEAEKVGSLYVPDTAKEKPQQGVVIAVGPGKREGGELIAPTIKQGDIILFGKYSGTEIQHETKDYLIIQESDVLAVIE